MAEPDELLEDAPLTAERCTTFARLTARHRLARPTRCLERARARYADDAERQRALARGRYHADRERRNAGNRTWKAAHPERVRELGRGNSRAYRARDPERQRRAHAAYRERNRAAFRRYWSERKQRRRTCADIEAHRAYAEVIAGDPCVYCGGETEQIDHIVALSRGGEDEWTNLAPSCASCNARKWAMPLLRFLLGDPRGR